MNSIVARPYPFTLNSEKPGLIIIDMQRDFVEPGGFGEALGNDVTPLKSIIPATLNLLSTFRKLGLPVIHTREAHQPDLSDCPAAKLRRGNSALKIGDEGPMGRILIADSHGNQIIEALAPIHGEYEILKPGKGAFYATQLDEILKQLGVSQLLITGVTTEVCVQTTMREANDRGYECVMVEDATESYFPEFKQATIEMMVAQGGIVGWVSTTTQIIPVLEQLYG